MKIEDEIKSTFRNEYHKGLVNLVFTAKQLNQQLFKILKSYKITEAQYNILRILRGNKSSKAASIGYIKERMLDQNSDVSRIVDKLFTKEYVSRIECPNDRRQKEIAISEKGLEILAKIDSCENKLDTFLANLNDDELATLNHLLDKIRD